MSTKKTTTRTSARKTEKPAPSQGKKKRKVAPTVAAVEVPIMEMAEAPSQEVATAAVAGEQPPSETGDTLLPEASPVAGETALTEVPALELAETSAQERTADEPSTSVRKPHRSKPQVEPQAPKMGALDAAVRVLEESGTPMNCKAMIGAMAVKGYWTSPAGKTPDATLYAAIVKEITSKRGTPRFQKTGRGQFAWREDRA